MLKRPNALAYPHEDETATTPTSEVPRFQTKRHVSITKCMGWSEKARARARARVRVRVKVRVRGVTCVKVSV